MDTQSVRNNISAVLLIITALCGASLVQYPRVLCPETFEYAKDGNNTIGIITVRNNKAGKTRVEIEMSQSGTIDSEYGGSVSLNFNKSRFSVFLGSSITYRVDFPLQNVTPRVNAIRINGEWECWGQKVPLPSATLVMEHILNVLEPNSSLPTQSLAPTKVIPRSNGIKFQIPMSMRRFYDQQLIRSSFEDFLVLSTDQQSSELSHKLQNTHLQVESVLNPGKNETENVIEEAPTTTTARSFSPTSTRASPLITRKLAATTTTSRPLGSSSTLTTTNPTPLQKVKPTQTEVKATATIGSSSSNNYTLGSDIVLFCIVTGWPIPNITWYKNNSEIFPSKSVQISEDPYKLVINRFARKDSGYYDCKVETTLNDEKFVERPEEQHVRPGCRDNPTFANCALIVRARYCSNKFYQNYCCLSCALDGQVPSERHIQTSRGIPIFIN